MCWFGVWGVVATCAGWVGFVCGEVLGEIGAGEEGGGGGGGGGGADSETKL